MTSVMRAMARPTGSRSLRAALVRGGKIIDERVVAPGEHLTVGPTERSTFVVAGQRAGVRLLEGSRDGYRLHLGPGMRGRVAIGGEVADLAGGDDLSPLALDDEARGKIEIGDTVVLFHFVEPTVAVARPQLPLAVRQGALDGMDWKTTCIAAFSFLLHFGAVGAMYSDFADATIEDDGASVTAAIQSLRPIPVPPLEVPTESATTGDKPTKTAAETAKPGGVAAPATGLRGGPASPAGAREKPGDVAAREIARQLDEEGRAVLLAIGGATTGRGAIGVVLGSGGDMPLGMLEGAARDAGGAGSGRVAGLSLGTGGGGVVRPGDRTTCTFCPPATVRRDPGIDDAGKQAEVKKPVPSTTVSRPDVPVGKLPDAGRTVGGLKPLLRQCYKRELDADPTAKGSVRVTATIGSNGDVSSVQTAANGLSQNMVACVYRVVKGAAFSAPEGGGSAQVAIPMSFYPQ
jgi:hypothetical protein